MRGTEFPKSSLGSKSSSEPLQEANPLDLFGNRIPKELFGKQILSKTSKDQ